MRPRHRFSGWAARLLLALSFLGVGKGEASFSIGWTGPNGDDNRGIAWADFNNDCKPDIVVVNNQPGSCVRVFRNNGDGTFTLMFTSTESDRCTAVAVADYDGDGLIDFAVSNYSGIPSRIYHNDGNFNFHVSWSEPYAEYSTGIDWGDYDNDGRPDLIINSLTAGGVRYFHNDGGGNFSDAGLVSTPGNAASTKLVDYDGDGFLDMFEGVTGYGSVIWKGNGTALPVSVCTLPWNNNSDVDWKDFDGDGHLDVIEAEYINVYRNAGLNTFPSYWNSGADSQFVRACDYDGDGLADYAMSDWAPRNFTIVHNNGGGTFAAIAGPSATGGPVAWADYDGDGHPDVVGGNFQGTAYNLTVYHNDGPGNYVAPLCGAAATPTATPTATAVRTATPTVTASPTDTDTPVATPTPPLAPDALGPFPNPASGNQTGFTVTAPGPVVVRWQIFTLAFRKIRDEGTFLMAPGGTLTWDLKDLRGNPVANGLYYLHVHLDPYGTDKVLKVLVAR